MSAPLKRRFPVTSSTSVGAALPMPRFPVSVRRILSTLFVMKGSAKLVVVPIDLAEVAILLPFWSQLVVAATVEGKTHVGAVPVPLDCNIYPAVPALLLGMNAPLKRKFPVTSSASVGAVLPIPTRPEDDAAISSDHVVPFQK
jgi:hypothetical protein